MNISVNKIKYASDLHISYLNISNLILLFEEHADKESALILVGDILPSKILGTNFLYDNFFDSISKNFKFIFIVLGNHDFYNSSLSKGTENYLDFLEQYNNIFLLSDSSDVTINNDYKLFGTTLWTDFNNKNKKLMKEWNNVMNDGLLIHDDKETGIITSNDIYNNFCNSFNNLMLFVQKYKNKNIIIATHHAPSQKSCSLQYINDIYSYYFYSNLDNFIKENKNIKYWLHGHMHNNSNYYIGSTNILCNPYGYSHERKGRKYILEEIYI